LVTPKRLYAEGQQNVVCSFLVAVQVCDARMPGKSCDAWLKKKSNIEEQKIAKRISVYKANDNALLKNEQL